MLAELYNRKVKVKNKDGNGYHYEIRPAVRKTTAKQKEYKNPKWVKKLVRTQQKHNKLRVTPTDWELMELEQKKRKLNNECGAKRKILSAEYDKFYAKYPYKKPKINKPRKSEQAEVPCSNPRFANCNAVVFTYPNGNRKIVTTEKVPKTVKPKKAKATAKRKGVSDGFGCGCNI